MEYTEKLKARIPNSFKPLKDVLPSLNLNTDQYGKYGIPCYPVKYGFKCVHDSCSSSRKGYASWNSYKVHLNESHKEDVESYKESGRYTDNFKHRSSSLIQLIFQPGRKITETCTPFGPSYIVIELEPRPSELLDTNTTEASRLHIASTVATVTTTLFSRSERDEGLRTTTPTFQDRLNANEFYFQIDWNCIATTSNEALPFYKMSNIASEATTERSKGLIKYVDSIVSKYGILLAKIIGKAPLPIKQAVQNNKWEIDYESFTSIVDEKKRKPFKHILSFQKNYRPVICDLILFLLVIGGEDFDLRISIPTAITNYMRNDHGLQSSITELKNCINSAIGLLQNSTELIINKSMNECLLKVKDLALKCIEPQRTLCTSYNEASVLPYFLFGKHLNKVSRSSTNGETVYSVKLRAVKTVKEDCAKLFYLFKSACIFECKVLESAAIILEGTMVEFTPNISMSEDDRKLVKKNQLVILSFLGSSLEVTAFSCLLDYFKASETYGKKQIPKLKTSFAVDSNGKFDHSTVIIEGTHVPLQIFAKKTMHLLHQKLPNLLLQVLDGIPAMKISDLYNMDIFDDVSSNEIGYSFITDDRNPFKRMFKEFSNTYLAKHFETHEGKLVYTFCSNLYLIVIFFYLGVLRVKPSHQGYVNTWCDTVNELDKLLYLLTHILSGQPGTVFNLSLSLSINIYIYIRYRNEIYILVKVI